MGGSTGSVEQSARVKAKMDQRYLCFDEALELLRKAPTAMSKATLYYEGKRKLERHKNIEGPKMGYTLGGFVEKGLNMGGRVETNTIILRGKDGKPMEFHK